MPSGSMTGAFLVAKLSEFQNGAESLVACVLGNGPTKSAFAKLEKLAAKINPTLTPPRPLRAERAKDLPSPHIEDVPAPVPGSLFEVWTKIMNNMKKVKTLLAQSPGLGTR